MTTSLLGIRLPLSLLPSRRTETVLTQIYNRLEGNLKANIEQCFGIAL